MRIAFVLPGFPRKPGGGHKIVYQYANELANLGNQVFVYHCRSRATVVRSPVGVLRDVVARLGYEMTRRRRPSWFDLDRRVEVRNHGELAVDRISGFDCVVATGVRTARAVADVVARDECVGVYLIQHYETFSADQDYVDSTWSLPLRRVVVSPWLAEVGSRLGVRCETILNPIDRREFPKGRSMDERDLSVLTLISEQSWKRSDVAIAVYDNLHEWNGSIQFKAFGVGSRPPSLPSYVDYFEDPSRDVLSRLYRSTTVYICTSDFEGFGLPAAEALASGAAVVSTRNGGVDSFASAGVLFADAGDVAGLANAAKRILADGDFAQQCADDGFTAIQDLTVGVAVKKLVGVVTDAA